MGIVYRYLITICLTGQYLHMPFKIKSCQQLRITIQFINYLTREICSSSCYNSGFNLLTYILSHWLHNCWFATITNQRDPLTGPPPKYISSRDIKMPAGYYGTAHKQVLVYHQQHISAFRCKDIFCIAGQQWSIYKGWKSMTSNKPSVHMTQW